MDNFCLYFISWLQSVSRLALGPPSIMLYGLQNGFFQSPGVSAIYFIIGEDSLLVICFYPLCGFLWSCWHLTLFLLSFGLLVMSFGFSTSCRWHVFSGGGCSSARSRGSWCPCVSYLTLPWLLSSPISLLRFVPFSCCVACRVLSVSIITCDVSTVPVFSIFSPC